MLADCKSRNGTVAVVLAKRSRKTMRDYYIVMEIVMIFADGSVDG